MRNGKVLIRIVLLALALCLLMGSVAVAAVADFTFSLNAAGDGYVLTGYQGADASVTIPDWYNQKPVTEVGDGAFQGNSNITEVSMPSTIVVIGEAAFKNCSKLNKVITYPAASEPPAPDHVAGDADDSGETNIYDALLVMQYQSGWNVSVNKTNSDVNGDGAVNLNDALLILLYGAGEDVTLQ